MRVFGGEQALDATAIHPDDYKLAQRLIAALQIPEPPSMPPGYQLPDYTRRAKGGAAGDAAKAGEAAPSTEETAEIAATAEAAEVQSADETGAVAVATEPAEVTTPVAEVAVEPAAEEAPTAQQEGAPELAPEIEGFGESKKPEMVASAAVAQVPEDEPEPEPISHPLPAEEKIRKVIKEWQVGQFRVRQIVQWLCQPFSTDRADGAPATVMGAVPQLSELKPGQAVAGVVVGVTPFGAFVELAPDCNGLVHVSRLTESYLEDPHEAVQVGDVVNAYVMEIDAKRRRVALSCISPERQAALDEQRRQQQQREFGGHGQGGGRGRDGGQGGQGGNFRGRGQQGGQQGGRGGHAEGGRGGQGQGQGQGGGRSAGRGGQGGSYGGGGGRGQQGGQQGGQRGGGRNFGQDRGGKFQRRDRKNSDEEQTTPPPRTTRVERAQPAKPLTDGMRTGNEPLRSFSDLMQFYSMRDAPETESAAATAAPESAEVVNNEAVETPPPANEA